jgi:hypothetical protein
LVVVGNKTDLERRISPEQGAAFAQGIQAAYVETSALSGTGVPDLFLSLAKLSFTA